MRSCFSEVSSCLRAVALATPGPRSKRLVWRDVGGGAGRLRMALEGGLPRARRAGRRKDFEMLAAWREEVGRRRVV